MCKELIGTGSSKKVFVHPRRPDLVLIEVHGIPGLPPNEAAEYTAKVRFYLQKILHFLLPEHFPNIYTSGSNPNMMIMDRVHPDPKYFTFKTESEELGRLSGKKAKSKRQQDRYAELEKRMETYSTAILVTHRGKELLRAVREIGIDIDDNLQNLAPVGEAGLMYVDSVDLPSGCIYFNKRILQARIDQIADPETRALLQRYADRAIALRESIAIDNEDTPQ